MTYSELKVKLLGYIGSRIDEDKEKYEYSTSLEYAVTDLYINGIRGNIEIILGDVHTKISIGKGRIDYAVNKKIKVNITHDGKWNRIMNNGKNTKFKKIKI